MMQKEKRGWKRIKGLIARWDRRLNDPEWLSQKFHSEHLSESEIADIIGCSPELVHEKLTKLFLTGADKIGAVYTGRFHVLAKRAIVWFAKPYIKNIQQTVDEIYDKTKARNSNLFKDILVQMEQLDRDTGYSSAKDLGVTRKEFYILLAKFLICLYEYDTYYSERIDYILKEVIAKRDEFYLDEFANPENWSPNRNFKTLAKYIVARNTPKGELVIVVNASEIIKKKK